MQKKKKKKEKQCTGYFYTYIGMKVRRFKGLLSLISWGIFYCISKNIFYVQSSIDRIH